MKRILVTGAGDFVGSRLVTHLKRQFTWVRGADHKVPGQGRGEADEFILCDLRDPESCHRAMDGVEEVYIVSNHTASLGQGAGQDSFDGRCSKLILTNCLDAASAHGIQKVVSATRGCPSPKTLLGRAKSAHLSHVYGEGGEWTGGQETGLAAVCRKVATVQLTGSHSIEMWGGGDTTTTYCYIEDAVRGLVSLMELEYFQPVLIQGGEAVSNRELIDLVSSVAEIQVSVSYVAGSPGKFSADSGCRDLSTVSSWRPHVSLLEGVMRTYPWIESRVFREASDHLLKFA